MFMFWDLTICKLKISCPLESAKRLHLMLACPRTFSYVLYTFHKTQLTLRIEEILKEEEIFSG